MSVAGVEVARGAPLGEATPEGIQRTTNVALSAIRGNYVGPLIAAVTFVNITFICTSSGTHVHAPTDTHAL